MMKIKKDQKGFTLIELMIVVAIIGILAAVAIPNFIEYRNKSKIAAAVATCSSIRAALASYAADSEGNIYPADDDIDDWDELVAIVNNNGGSLADTALEQGFSADVTYDGIDDEETDVFTDYNLTLEVSGVPTDKLGSILLLQSSGIFRQSSSS